MSRHRLTRAANSDIRAYARQAGHTGQGDQPGQTITYRKTSHTLSDMSSLLVTFPPVKNKPLDHGCGSP